MSDVTHWISRYWGILVVLAGIVFWAGRLEMKVVGLDEKIVGFDGRVASLEQRVASLEEKVDLILQILLDGDYSHEASKIAQESGAAD